MCYSKNVLSRADFSLWHIDASRSSIASSFNFNVRTIKPLSLMLAWARRRPWEQNIDRLLPSTTSQSRSSPLSAPCPLFINNKPLFSFRSPVWLLLRRPADIRQTISNVWPPLKTQPSSSTSTSSNNDRWPLIAPFEWTSCLNFNLLLWLED